MADSDKITTVPLERLTCAGGSIKLGAGAFTGKYLYYIQANEATIIAALDGFDQSGFAINWLSVLGCSTMAAGERYILPDHCYIKTGEITSGSLECGKIKG